MNANSKKNKGDRSIVLNMQLSEARHLLDALTLFESEFGSHTLNLLQTVAFSDARHELSQAVEKAESDLRLDRSYRQHIYGLLLGLYPTGVTSRTIANDMANLDETAVRQYLSDLLHEGKVYASQDRVEGSRGLKQLLWRANRE